MKITKILISLSFLLFIPILMIGQDDDDYDMDNIYLYDCETLVEYRDNDLDDKMDEAFQKYRITESSLEQMEKVREELEEVEWSVENGSLIISLLSIVKVTSNFITDVGSPADVDGATTSFLKTMDKLDDVALTVDAVTNGLEETVAKEALKRASPVTRIAVAFGNGFQNVYEMVENLEETEKCKSEMLENIRLLEEFIAVYNYQLSESEEVIEWVNDIKEAIDAHCN